MNELGANWQNHENQLVFILNEFICLADYSMNLVVCLDWTHWVSNVKTRRLGCNKKNSYALISCLGITKDKAKIMGCCIHTLSSPEYKHLNWLNFNSTVKAFRQYLIYIIIAWIAQYLRNLKTRPTLICRMNNKNITMETINIFKIKTALLNYEEKKTKEKYKTWKKTNRVPKKTKYARLVCYILLWNNGFETGTKIRKNIHKRYWKMKLFFNCVFCFNAKSQRQKKRKEYWKIVHHLIKTLDTWTRTRTTMKLINLTISTKYMFVNS